MVRGAAAHLKLAKPYREEFPHLLGYYLDNIRIVGAGLTGSAEVVQQHSRRHLYENGMSNLLCSKGYTNSYL